MHAHDHQMVELLSVGSPQSAQSLAASFGVSERSIRSYVRDANEALAGVATIRRSGKGYVLDVTNQAALEAWLAARGEGVRSTSALPQTNEGRVAYLLDDLLSRTDWITSGALARMLYVSPRTISSNLKDVERMLARFGLVLERRPHYGLKVEGPELQRRLCLANVTMGRMGEGGLLRDLMLDRVASCVDEALHARNFQVNSVAYQNLLVHIGVAVLRIQEGHRMPVDPASLERVSGTREYEVAADVARRIRAAFDVEIPEAEVAYIAIHLMGKRLIDEMDATAAQGAISDDVWQTVSEMLDVVNEIFHFDFRGDLELRMNLARHIVPLSARLAYHMNLTNPLLSDIKTRFPLAYSMALEASVVLARAYGAAMSEDEVGYIAFAMALALERKKGAPPRKNILVVCASGVGSSRLLEYQYRKEFGPYLNKVVACDLSQLADMDFSDIDYVFTTVPIERALPVPVRQVGFFLEGSDREGIRQLLSSHTESASPPLPFDERLFLPHLRGLAGKDEVLELLCARAAEVEGVDEGDFLAAVLAREREAPTAFGNEVAMPHPIAPLSERTFVAVALLDDAVRWGDHEVRAVFLVSIAKDRDPPRDFYERLAGLFGSEEALQGLLADQTLEKLLEVTRPSEREERP